MPKSSIAIRTPSSFSSRSRATAMSASASMTVSVISSTSDAAGNRVASSASRTSLDDRLRLKLLDREVDADRERLRSVGTGAADSTPCLQASRSTHWPIGRIRPVSSASGMNCAGAMSPRVGMVPAQQCLDAVVGAGPEPHDRLVVDLELVELECALKLGCAARAARRRARASAARTDGNCPCGPASPCTWRRRRFAAAPRHPARADPRRSCRCRRWPADRPASPR